MVGMTRLRGRAEITGPVIFARILRIVCGVFALLALGVAAEAERPWTVQIAASDKVVLVGTIYPAAGTLEKAPVVLFVHGWGRDRGDWDAHARGFGRAGVLAMALDLRGHGESVRRRTRLADESVLFSRLTEFDEALMVDDLLLAIDYLGRHAGADPARVVLVGADLGANLALKAACRHGSLKGAVLLSPRWQIRSVGIREDLARGARLPLLVVGGEKEPAFDDVRQIAQALGGPGTSSESFFVPEESAGGARLLGIPPGNDRVLAWILERLAP